MKIWTKALLFSSIPFLCFFAFGITGFGQNILRGPIPPGTDHWRLDDIYMGAGLAPCLFGTTEVVPCYKSARRGFIKRCVTTYAIRGLANQGRPPGSSGVAVEV
jgi:hypothetical protein